MIKIVDLEKWEVWAFGADPANLPNAIGCKLTGVVTGHPRKPDGEEVVTTRIVKVEGRLITTKSGTVYRLGAPSLEYRDHLRVVRPDWDPEDPLASRLS